jgi:hypothetical protein
MTTDKNELLNVLINESKPLRVKLKDFDKKINALKKEIEIENKNKMYLEFDESLKKYYTFSLPDKEGSDWTYLTGYFGANTKDMVSKIDSYFDNFDGCNRYQKFDVKYAVFDSDLFGRFFADYYDETIVLDKLNILSDSENLQTFDGLDDDFVLRIKEFINIYTSIQVDCCIHDW